MAAKEIIDRYVSNHPIGNGLTMDFKNHAWVRLNTFVDMFSTRILELARALNRVQPGIDYQNLIQNANGLHNADIQSLQQFINQLLEITRQFTDGDIVRNRDRPLPKGTLRDRPML